MSARRPLFLLLPALFVCFTLISPLAPIGPQSAAVAAAGPTMTGLHVSGNQFVNGAGQTVRLLGVNRAGMEFACIQGWGIFDGPSDAASVAAIASWGSNTVRIPVNEDCWLGINGVNPAYGGANYQNALANYIGLINAQGMAAIIDLHWTAPGTTLASAQTPMPDRDHAATFWTQVANAYKGNSAVIFDLFNEPYPDNNQDTTEAWRCWRDGGTCAGVGYQAAGMQELVNAVRGTGATNIILLGGVAYASHLSRWLDYRPTDTTGNLAAAWHIYNFSQCNTQACWDAEAGPVAAQVPLVGGEIGQNNCAHDFVDALMDWHDARGASYLGWTWNVWDCGSGPALISNYDGTPTNFGIGIKNRFSGVGPTPSPSPSPLPSPPAGTTVVDDLNDFGEIATRSANLGFDTTNTSVIGNDPSRLVRVARSAEWAVWGLQGMRSFTAITYAWRYETFTPFTFAASPDGVTYAPLSVTPVDRGGEWQRMDYALTLPAGTNFVRVTFPNTGANAWTPQIGQVTYSSAGASASPTPTPSPSPTPAPSATPSPSPSATPSPSPTPAPSATPSPTPSPSPSATPGPSATPSPTPSPSAGPSSFHVTATNGGGVQTQETQYRVRLYNNSATAQRGLKARIFLNLSELSAAGLTAQNVVSAKSWDQCNAVRIGPVTAWDSARSLYYVDLNWQGYTFVKNSFCEVQFSLHLSGWQDIWSAANDPSAQGLGASTYLTTQNVPVYRNGVKVYGVEP